MQRTADLPFIKQRIAESGISMRELARRSGVHLTTIHAVLSRGRDVKHSTVVRLLKAVSNEKAQAEQEKA